MKERLLRAGSLAAAAVAIGGILIAIMPQHAGNIAGLVIITTGIAVALYALAANVPEWTEASWLASPFNLSATSDEEGPVFEEADRIRRRLEGRRQALEGGPAITPEAIRLLRPLIRATLERERLDPRNPADHERIRERLSSLTRRVLATKPVERPTWLNTRAPDPARVARVVHRVLDDLEPGPAHHRPTNESDPQPRGTP